MKSCLCGAILILSISGGGIGWLAVDFRVWGDQSQIQNWARA